MKIEIEITNQVKMYLADLVTTGLYGPTPETAAARLIDRGLAQAIEDKTISRRFYVER